MTDGKPVADNETPKREKLNDAAIAAALKQNWQEAIRLNTQILESEGNNVDALNRLGFAYFQEGDTTHAKQAFQKVLKLDEYNQIAEKNLKKLSIVKKKPGAAPSANVSPLMFLEEPGKTKIVMLVNLAPERILTQLTSGQEVFLKEKRHTLEVRDNAGTYLGALPDDLSFKLTKFMKGGNIYTAVIKSIGKNQLVVFLREVVRSKKFAHQPSFVSTLIYPATHGEGEMEGPDTTPTGEEAEETEEVRSTL